MLRAVTATTSHLLYCVTEQKSLLEPELFFQHRFVCDGVLSVVIFWVFEFLMYRQRREEHKGNTRTKGERDKDVFLYVFANAG